MRALDCKCRFQLSVTLALSVGTLDGTVPPRSGRLNRSSCLSALQYLKRKSLEVAQSLTPMALPA